MKKLLFLAVLVLGMSSCSLHRECRVAVPDIREVYGYKVAHNISDEEFEAIESYMHIMYALDYLDSQEIVKSPFYTSKYWKLHETCMDMMYNRDCSIVEAVVKIQSYIISYDIELYNQIMK
jgi:hypothetical protein